MIRQQRSPRSAPGPYFCKNVFLKDYYDILELPPSATHTEIKKAYRRLALLYHPDKNPGDPYAAARFGEIKEAYEVLLNPRRRDAWLQERWYQQSLGRRKKEAVLTPVSLLREALELEKQVSRLDWFRMDKTGLRDYLLEICSRENLEKIKAFGETETNRQIIRTFLKAMQPLSKAVARPALEQLRWLAGEDSRSLLEIDGFHRHLNRKHQEERFQPWLIVLLTAALCTLIWWLGR